MLKWLAILGLVLGLAQAPINAPGQRRDKQNHPYRNAGKGNPAAPTIAQPAIEAGAIAKKTEGKPKDDPPEQKPSYWKEAFSPANLPNWALVLVGALAGFLAWRTLNAIKRQADTMDRQASEARESAEKATAIAVKSANAALLNAQAVMNAERAWITVNLAQQPTFEEMNSVANPDDDTWTMGIGLEFTNSGRTPALISDGYARAILVDTVDPVAIPVIPALGDEPEYDGGEQNRAVMRDDVLVPRKKWRSIVAIEKSLFREKYGEWRQRSCALCIYGFIEYADVFQGSIDEVTMTQNPRHVTRFCFVYQISRPGGYLAHKETGKLLFPPAFCVGGPGSYNRIT